MRPECCRILTLAQVNRSEAEKEIVFQRPEDIGDARWRVVGFEDLGSFQQLANSETVAEYTTNGIAGVLAPLFPTAPREKWNHQEVRKGRSKVNEAR